METLVKRKRGKPLKFDFSDLKQGQTRLLGTSRNLKKNPVAYITYWNKKHPDKKVEVLVDEKNNPYVRLVEKILNENV